MQVCYHYVYNHSLVESSQVLGDLERCAGRRLHLFHGHSLCQLYQGETSVDAIHVKYGHVGDDAADARNSGLWQTALLDELWSTVLVQSVGHDVDLGFVGV